MLKIFTKGEKKLLKSLKMEYFQFIYDERQEYQMKAQRKIEQQEEFFKYIENKSKGVNNFLFKHYFNFVYPSDLAKKLFEIKDKKKNNDFVEEIKNRWSKIKDEIEDMSKDERKNKGLDKILEIVKEILKFNEQNQQGKGLKILTPNQMLNRLPIALSQLQAGNNSDKLKNEIRQLSYSLYRLKNMAEQIYKNLIGII